MSVSATPQKALRESAKAEISTANMTIQAAASGGRTMGLEKATMLLFNALDAFNKGDYNSSIMLAQQAEQAADSATSPQSLSSVATSSISSIGLTSTHVSSTALPQWYLTYLTIVAIVGIMTIAVAQFTRSRNQKKTRW